MSTLPREGGAGTNSATLQSYEDRTAAYIDGTSQVVAGASKAWIDAALDGLPADARILELGSAFGRDAAYIAARGFAVGCTDAVPSFISHLRDKGFPARRLNVLTDPIEGRYDLILANAVLLHFDRREFVVVLEKLARAAARGGRIAFSLKRGIGETWSTDKLGAPRYFCYWEPDALKPILDRVGFARWTVDEAQTDRAHAAWLYVIATVP